MQQMFKQIPLLCRVHKQKNMFRIINVIPLYYCNVCVHYFTLQNEVFKKKINICHFLIVLEYCYFILKFLIFSCVDQTSRFVLGYEILSLFQIIKMLFLSTYFGILSVYFKKVNLPVPYFILLLHKKLHRCLFGCKSFERCHNFFFFA